MVRYIREHRDDFEPFLEEDAGKGFDDYVRHLAQDGIYAGHWYDPLPSFSIFFLLSFKIFVGFDVALTF